MQIDMHPGLILSKEEGRETRKMIYDARDRGDLDTVTAFEMSFDVLVRTVPSA